MECPRNSVAPQNKAESDRNGVSNVTRKSAGGYLNFVHSSWSKSSSISLDEALLEGKASVFSEGARMLCRMRILAVTVLALGASVLMPVRAQDRRPVRTVEEGILDQIVLFAEKLPAADRVAIRTFSATDADITVGEKKEETKKMQVDGPPMLNQQFVAKLKELGPFAEVSVLEAGGNAPAEALLIEGKFIEMDPGSRAKRYFVGFGAGKSGVTVEGSVKSAGAVVATFKQRRIGAIGAFGGDSMGKLIADTRDIGEDMAKFVSAWAKGQKLN